MAVVKALAGAPDVLVVLIDEVSEDTGMPVNVNDDVPFKFTRKIRKVTIELK